MKNKRLTDTFGADFRAWARENDFILICPRIETYSKELIFIAVKKNKGFNGDYYTFGRIYNICGLYDYNSQGFNSYKTHKDATRAACEFFGIN